MTIPTVSLAGKQVGRVGLGLMQLTWSPAPPPDDVRFAAMKAAADAGATTWSSATFYGHPPDGLMDNVKLIGRFFEKYPEYIGKIQLVIKGGLVNMAPTNDIDVNRQLLAEIKQALGPVPIDVYLPARILPGVDPVEYFAPFEALRREGHFGALGASEVSATTLRALSKRYDIAVVEIEVSLWSWEQDVQDVVAWSKETHTPVYAYSPLGRGFLTGKFKTPQDLAGSPLGRMPRFQGEAFKENLKLVDVLDALARRKGITNSQLAIAWVLSLSPYTIPIPGSSNAERVTQNTESANIKLTAEDLQKINDILAKFEPQGGRYPEAMAQVLMV